MGKRFLSAGRLSAALQVSMSGKVTSLTKWNGGVSPGPTILRLETAVAPVSRGPA